MKKYTKASFIKKVIADGQVFLDKPCEHTTCFKVIRKDGVYYGACCDDRYNDERIIGDAKVMQWYSPYIENVILWALKERGVHLLQRANEYLQEQQA